MADFSVAADGPLSVECTSSRQPQFVLTVEAQTKRGMIEFTGGPTLNAEAINVEPSLIVAVMKEQTKEGPRFFSYMINRNDGSFKRMYGMNVDNTGRCRKVDTRQLPARAF